MEERFFDDGNVLVTNSRVIAQGDTYALANITSCKVRQEELYDVNEGLKVLRFLVAVVGVVLSLWVASELGRQGGACMIWLVGVVLSVLAAMAIKYKFAYMLYSIHLGDSSGEQKVLASRDRDWIFQIADAVNHAIVARG